MGATLSNFPACCSLNVLYSLNYLGYDEANKLNPQTLQSMETNNTIAVTANQLRAEEELQKLGFSLLAEIPTIHGTYKCKVWLRPFTKVPLAVPAPIVEAKPGAYAIHPANPFRDYGKEYQEPGMQYLPDKLEVVPKVMTGPPIAKPMATWPIAAKPTRVPKKKETNPCGELA